MAKQSLQLSAAEVASYPYQDMPYVAVQLDIRELQDGSYLLHTPIDLKPAEKSIPHLFARQAQRYPDRIWLAEKENANDWYELSYASFDKKSDSVAQWLLNQHFGPDTPLMVLSENSLSHALMIMGAMKARVPVASISAPYSLMDPSLQKLKLVTGILKPKIIFAQCAERYGNALDELEKAGHKIICQDNISQAKEDSFVDITELFSTPIENVAESIAQINHDTIAKYMFTSGSTGTPKCVVQTQGILCGQVAGLDSIKANLNPDEYQPRSLQWMPWSHVSAGNIAYHEAMLVGGSIYIDDGKPVPGLFDKTIENLRGLSTSVFGSAPLGLSWLATALEQDVELQEVFFKELEAIAYGGSALPEDIALRLQRLSIANTGKRVPIISMYGSTETQGITATYWATDIPGVIGLPMPGMTLKLVPSASKLEVRAKGPTVMQSYLDEPALSAESFDDDGFFKLGDAARFADQNDPLQGLVFDGRISEDFKLLSGTWVSTVSIKAKLLKSMGSLIRDLVVCGENQAFVCALAWLDKAAAKEFAKSESDDTESAINTVLRAELQQPLDRYNKQNPGSSNQVKSLLLLNKDASMALGEVNEKGYINSKLLAKNRQHLLTEIYAEPSKVGVIEENNQ